MILNILSVPEPRVKAALRRLAQNDYSSAISPPYR